MAAFARGVHDPIGREASLYDNVLGGLHHFKKLGRWPGSDRSGLRLYESSASRPRTSLR